MCIISNIALGRNGILAASDSIDTLWLMLGILAQLLVVIALVGNRAASVRAGRPTVSTSAVSIGIVGVALSGIYAIVRQEWILAASQGLMVFVGAVLLTSGRAETSPVPERPRLPEVKPDSAEIKLHNIDPRRESIR